MLTWVGASREGVTNFLFFEKPLTGGAKEAFIRAQSNFPAKLLYP